MIKDAITADQVRPLIPAPAPEAAVVLTTRMVLRELYELDFVDIPLGKLPDDDSHALLTFGLGATAGVKGRSAATTNEQYIEGLDEPRRSDLRTLHELVRTTVPDLESTMEFGVLRQIPLPVRLWARGQWSVCRRIVLRPAPQGIHRQELYPFRRLSDVDTTVLAEILRVVGANPPGELVR